jgi:hypothetical protein
MAESLVLLELIHCRNFRQELLPVPPRMIWFAIVDTRGFLLAINLHQSGFLLAISAKYFSDGQKWTNAKETIP